MSVVLNPNLDIAELSKMIASSFMDRVECTKEVIEQETEIELLEWEGSHNEMSFVSPKGVTYKFMPEIKQRDYQGNRGYGKHPEYMEEDFFGDDNNCDPQDISYNYIPYKMDSAFEQNALNRMRLFRNGISGMPGKRVASNGNTFYSAKRTKTDV